MKNQTTPNAMDKSKTLIEVPAAWTQTEDENYFREIFGDPKHGYHSEFAACLDWALSENERVLDRVLVFLCSQCGLPTFEVASKLSESSKLQLLLVLSERSAMPEAVRKRILAGVHHWKTIANTTSAVLQRYVLDPKSVWLRELADAHDLIVVVGTDLERTFESEFPQFRSFARSTTSALEK